MPGKTFYTLREARQCAKKEAQKGRDLEIRKLSKKTFPRHKKRYFVGDRFDWLDFG